MALIRTYTDVHGNKRVATLIKNLDRIVPYLDGHSPTQLWLIEDCKLYIPTRAWDEITYRDTITDDSLRA